MRFGSRFIRREEREHAPRTVFGSLPRKMQVVCELLSYFALAAATGAERQVEVRKPVAFEERDWGFFVLPVR